MNVKLTYKVLEDYSLNSSRLKVSLKKGIEISEDDLIKKFGGEQSFKYLMSCTRLKKVLEVCLLEEVTKEETTEVGSTKEETPEEGSAKEETPEEGSAKEETPEEGSAKEETPEEGSAKEETPEEGSAKEETPEEGSAKEETTEEGSAKEETPDMIFTIKEDLYRGKSKNVLVEKGSKISLKELKLNFSNSQIKKFVSNKQIMEIKVSV